MYFDVILIGDLRLPGGATRQIANEVRVLAAAGYSVGLVNVEMPHARGAKPVDPLIRARLSAGEAQLLQDGLDELEAGLLIFENPRAFMGPVRHDLRVRAQRALIALHFPALDGTGTPTFDPAQVQQICQSITETPLSWAGTSPLTRELLVETYPDLDVAEGILPCIIFPDEFRTKRKGPLKSIPVIGRHSRPHLDKWPPTRKALLQVYPARDDVEVALLGVDEELRKLAGRYPRNWRTYEFNEIPPREFLQGIDFFVYYHHPRWVEAFGIATAEAMASGAVALLPEYMRVNFGGGALYTAPEKALAMVRALHKDKAAFRRQSERGAAYIRKHYSPTAYLTAIAPYLETRRPRRPSRRKTVEYDVVILGDMRQVGGEAVRIARETAAAVQAGFRVGLMHAAETSQEGRVRPEVDACIAAGLAEVVDMAGGLVKARLLIVHSLQSFLSLPPESASALHPGRVVIVASRAPKRADILLAERLLKKSRGQRLSWAPVSDAVRVQLEERGADIVIEAANWRPVSNPVGTARRADRLPVVAVAQEPGGEAAEFRKLAENFPRDGTLRLRIHGAPADKTLQQFLPLTGWETFKAHEMALSKVLDGADFFFCSATKGEEVFPDVAAAEAMARGIPLVATPDLRRHLGEAAVYCSLHEAAEEIRRLHASPRRYAERSRASLKRAAGFHSQQQFAARLGELTGRRPKPPRGTAKHRTPRRVLMFSQNGVGLGHVVRQLAVSRELSKTHDVVFCSLSQAIDVIGRYGYPVEYLPSHVYSGVNYADWHGWARAQLEQMIDFYDVGTVVLDGSVPYLGLLEAVAPRDDLKLAWVRRPMWPAGPESALRLAQQKFFDLIIEPEEVAGEMDTGPTVEHRDRALCVAPIRLFDKSQLLPRREAAAALGLDPTKPSVLIQLGSGTNRDIVELTDRIVSQARSREGLQVMIAEWLNANERLDLWPDVPCLQGFPYSRYYNAFDFSFSAAGYNSFHEILAYGLPTAFIVNSREYMDGQDVRAAYAAHHGAGLTCNGTHLDVAAAFERLMDPSARKAMRRAMLKLARPNGAHKAAQAIARLAAEARL